MIRDGSMSFDKIMRLVPSISMDELSERNDTCRSERTFVHLYLYRKRLLCYDTCCIVHIVLFSAVLSRKIEKGDLNLS